MKPKAVAADWETAEKVPKFATAPPGIQYTTHTVHVPCLYHTLTLPCCTATSMTIDTLPTTTCLQHKYEVPK